MQIQKYTESLGNAHLNTEKQTGNILKARLEELFQTPNKNITREHVNSKALSSSGQPSLFQKGFQYLPQPVQFVLKIIIIPFQAGFIITTHLIDRSIIVIESLISKVLPFFFGFKKDRIEERYRRDKDDFAKTDLFTRRVVEETTNESPE